MGGTSRLGNHEVPAEPRGWQTQAARGKHKLRWPCMSHGLHAAVVLAVLGVPFQAAQADRFDTSADAVIGQSAMTRNQPNQPDTTPTASNLAPSNAAGLAVGPDGRVYIADADNNRVMSWPDAEAFLSGSGADLVIGQPDFTSGAPNRGFPDARADGFNLPQGVAVDEAGNLWVADAFNSRVLKFNNPATLDGVADLVIGQPDFVSSGGNFGAFEDHASADSILFPGRVIARGDSVYVADSGNSRVLHYTNPTQNKPPADLVFGQFGDFTRLVKNQVESSSCENGGDIPCGPPSADNLFNPIGLALDDSGNVYIADWNNHRVLRFDDPLHTDTTADAVYGQLSLAGGSPNAGGTRAGLWLPIDLVVDNLGRLLVADSANHRVIVYDDPLGEPASRSGVFGQLDDPGSNEENHGLGPFATDADGLLGPTGVAVTSSFHVMILDTGNSRALRFDRPLRGLAPGDYDGDGDTDLEDVASWANCFSGSSPPANGCQFGDVDGEGSVDQIDAEIIMACLSGPAIPAERNCGP